MEGRKVRRGPGQARWVKGAVWRSAGWTCSGSGPGKQKRGMAMMNQNTLLFIFSMHLQSPTVNTLMRQGQKQFDTKLDRETSVFSVSIRGLTAVTETFLQDQMRRNKNLQQFLWVIKNMYIYCETMFRHIFLILCLLTSLHDIRS